MTWEQKLAAFQALGDTSLRMRVPGDWYVSADSVNVKAKPDDCFVTGLYGNGATPEAAVEDHWRQLASELEPSAHLSIRSGERRVRWNGFMWADVLV